MLCVWHHCADFEKGLSCPNMGIWYSQVSKMLSTIFARGWKILQQFPKSPTTFWSHGWRAGGLWQLWNLKQKKKSHKAKSPALSKGIEGGVSRHRRNEMMNRKRKKLEKWKITIVLYVKRSLYESQWITAIKMQEQERELIGKLFFTHIFSARKWTNPDWGSLFAALTEKKWTTYHI